MQERILHQPAAVAEMSYIACDLAVDETLTDFRRRAGQTRRRWWQVGQR